MASNRENRYASIYIDGNAANDTISNLRKESRLLKNELDKLPRSSAEFAEKAKQLQDVEDRLRSIRDEAKGVGGAFENLKGELVGIGKGLLASFSVAGAIAAGRKMITQNAELSDSFAAVMKTTGLTQVEVESLNRELANINTRTAKQELLALAEVAGRVGISAKNDVLGFVKAADIIGVSLGEELGGVEAAMRDIGKLTDIFKVKEEFGIESAILKVGSAINSLGNSGTVAESKIIDFTKRMAGVAPAAGIALPNVMGLAATLDELGQQMETSSTAAAQFLVSLGKDIPRFAKILKMTEADFSKLLKEDANEAFLRVLEASKTAGGGMEKLAESMGMLGVAGRGGVAALGALADNTDLLRARQELAREEFEAGTSVIEEFGTVNNTLAGNIEKLWNKLALIWENGTFRDGLTKLTGSMVEWIDKLRGVDNTISSTVSAYNAQKASMGELDGQVKGLLRTYDDLKGKTQLSKDEQLKLNTTVNEIARLVPEAISQWDQYGRAMDINRGKVEKFTEAQRQLMQTRQKDAIADLEKAFNDSVMKAGTFQNNAGKVSKVLAAGQLDNGNPLNDKQKASLSKDYIFYGDQKTLEMGKAYDAAIAMRDMGAKVTPAMEKIIKFFDGDGKKVVGNTSGDGTGGSTGGDKKKDKKTDAEREAERAKEAYDRLLKEDKAFKEAMELADKSWYEKELAAESAKYQKQIDNWKEFLDKKGLTSDQKNEATSKIKSLETERDDVALPKLRLKLEEEAVDKINKIRVDLGNKLRTELEREQKLINEHYDGLAKKYAGNPEMLAKIEENRAVDLTNAKVREEERFQKEAAKLREMAGVAKLNERDREKAELSIKMDAELIALEEKYSAELMLLEDFELAKQDIINRYAEEAKIKEMEFEEDKRRKIKDMVVDMVQSTADATFAIMSSNNDMQLSNKLSSIDRQRQQELRAVNLTEAEKKGINDKYDMMQRREKERAWKAQQKADMIQAGINTALAVTRALPNWINAAAVGVAGLAQMAVIASKPVPQFFHGGYTAEPEGWVRKPTIFNSASGGQFSAGENFMSEYVVSSDMLRDPLVADFVSMMEAGRTNQVGGLMAPSTTVVQQGADNSKLEGLMAEMVDALNNSQDKKVILVYSDLEDVQNRKTEIVNQANA